jgi:glycosyltransferase involved in cell wall biosynthesis
MAMLYSAVDVTVVPSRQENLSQVAMESLACGTPVVAFHTTGLPEVVNHRQNGYLAEPFDPAALAYGIQWVLEDADRYRLLSLAARSKAVQSYDVEVQAEHYHRLYDELLATPTTNAA